jgi:hypothetical protein
VIRTLLLVLLLCLGYTMAACARSPAPDPRAERPAATFGMATLPPPTATPPPAPPPIPPPAAPTAAPSPTPSPTPPAIRTVDWPAVIARELRTEGGAAGVHLADVIAADLTGDGEDEAIVPISSEGTAGIIGVYVYTMRGDQPLRVLALREAQLNVSVEGGLLVVTAPAYAPGDPRCCPSQLRRTTYRWTGTALEPASTELVPNPNR